LIKILRKPITATSANLSGRTPNYSIEGFLRSMSKKKKDMIDLVVNAGKLPRNKPSTVIDATESEIKILRRGDLITKSSNSLISKSERETEKIAEFLLHKSLSPRSGGALLPLKKGKQIQKPLVFLLSGDLGCGKTVFSRKIGHLLGVKEKITSPTFVIYNEYSISPNPSLTRGEQKINKFLHMDLYKITSEKDLEEIKFLEMFIKNTISCIEWPENMGIKSLEKLKKKAKIISINFEYLDEKTREIRY
jgi:tRNA threonylcarbamoyl adenosine modification protein YjeE